MLSGRNCREMYLVVNLGRGENAKDLFSHSSTSKDDFLLVHSFALKKMKKKSVEMFVICLPLYKMKLRLY